MIEYDIGAGAMGVSLLKLLLRHISSFFQLSSSDYINLQPTLKYYHKIEGVFKLLKPILDAVVDSDIASDEELIKAFEELDHSVDELRVLFENWQPLSSKVYLVSSTLPLLFLSLFLQRLSLSLSSTKCTLLTGSNLRREILMWKF